MGIEKQTLSMALGVPGITEGVNVMTDQIPQPRQSTQSQGPSYQAGHRPEAPRREGHSGHELMMIACILPILVLGILVFTGVVGSGALLYAVFCMLMMGVMMFAMSRML